MWSIFTKPREIQNVTSFLCFHTWCILVIGTGRLTGLDNWINSIKTCFPPFGLREKKKLRNIRYLLFFCFVLFLVWHNFIYMRYVKSTKWYRGKSLLDWNFQYILVHTVVAKIIRTLVFSPVFAINCKNPVRFWFAQEVWQQPVLHTEIWSDHHPVCLEWHEETEQTETD